MSKIISINCCSIFCNYVYLFDTITKLRYELKGNILFIDCFLIQIINIIPRPFIIFVTVLHIEKYIFIYIVLL